MTTDVSHVLNLLNSNWNKKRELGIEMIKSGAVKARDVFNAKTSRKFKVKDYGYFFDTEEKYLLFDYFTCQQKIRQFIFTLGFEYLEDAIEYGIEENMNLSRVYAPQLYSVNWQENSISRDYESFSIANSILDSPLFGMPHGIIDSIRFNTSYETDEEFAMKFVLLLTNDHVPYLPDIYFTTFKNKDYHELELFNHREDKSPNEMIKEVNKHKKLAKKYGEQFAFITCQK